MQDTLTALLLPAGPRTPTTPPVLPAPCGGWRGGGITSSVEPLLTHTQELVNPLTLRSHQPRLSARNTTDPRAHAHTHTHTGEPF